MSLVPDSPQMQGRVPFDEVKGVVEGAGRALQEARRILGRPLRLADKLMASHMPTDQIGGIDTAGTILSFRPERLAMPDSSAQMALLQFMSTSKPAVALPTTIHCDHLIRAAVDAAHDLAVSDIENVEIFDFLRSASARYGIGFWSPGSGIIHQVILERYAYPGGMLIGADSHTPNAGGLGMLAIGAGGAQAVDLMVGQMYELPAQRVIGVELTGRLSGFTSAKDVILEIARRLTVSGGTGAIIEYFGEGVASLSATGRATVCNMGAELGATTSIFPADDATLSYLRATGRGDIADLYSGSLDDFRADIEVTRDPVQFYSEFHSIDLSELAPQIVGPHSPDRGRPLRRLKEELVQENWPAVPAQALVGSCTNSSYEDIGRAAHVARQAAAAGLKVRVPLLVTPGSETIRATVERDGLLADLEAIGATVLANACGPCIGQWSRSDVLPGEKNSIITSFNRNFPGRNDGSAETLAFIASPETVISIAIAGTLAFDPESDTLEGSDGEPIRLLAPDGIDTLPHGGFDTTARGFQAPATPAEAGSIKVRIRPGSDRLQALEAFPAWTEPEYTGLPILLKVDGRCTTDHISPAGPWLRFRGHLDRISDNMFIGANNVWSPIPGHGIDRFDGHTYPLHELARRYKARGLPWVVIGGDNYGEGSSREHAAMEPRHLGCLAVIARGFARIHETNLKKHGVLPLRFTDPEDHGRLGVSDSLDVLGLNSLAPGRPVTVRVNPPDQDSWEMICSHSLTESEIGWFRAGSALNAFTG